MQYETCNMKRDMIHDMSLSNIMRFGTMELCKGSKEAFTLPPWQKKSIKTKDNTVVNV